MKRRCPHCQTTPLREDAETCWYCGKDYQTAPSGRRLRRVRVAAPASLSRRRSESRHASTTSR
jgi:hypothetical protein